MPNERHFTVNSLSFPLVPFYVGTFLFVSLVFSILFFFMNIPLYLSFVFGGIALATATAPVLLIVNEYHTNGPITKTLIPLAAIDDVIGEVIFFTTISIIGSTFGQASTSYLVIIGIILFLFVVGIVFGLIFSLIIKKINNYKVAFVLILIFLLFSSAFGLLIDIYIFKSFSLNYLLIGISFSLIVVNLVAENKLTKIFSLYKPLLNLSLIIVIVNLGMPLDYKLISGAGLFTFIYIYCLEQ